MPGFVLDRKESKNDGDGGPYSSDGSFLCDMRLIKPTS